MKRKKIGNGFTFLWKLKPGGIALDLSLVENIKIVRYIDAIGRVPKQVAFDVVTENILSINVTQKVADYVGKYILEISYDLKDSSIPPHERAKRYDTDAFIIVARTADEDPEDEITIESEFASGFQGKAFTSDMFTEEEWNRIQLPAVEAAATANAAAAAAANQMQAIGATMQEWETDEATRGEDESQRNTNETSRNDAETTRLNNEEIRIAQENTRTDNETARSTAEMTRENKETERLLAETDRIESEQTRSATETERNAAEDGRNAAEQLRSTAESTREINETARADAETAREVQETKRQADTGIAIKAINAAKDDYYDVVKPAIQIQGEYATAQGDYAKAQREAIQDDLALKANHGYASIEVAKTLKQVEDNTSVKMTNIFTNGDFSNGLTEWGALLGMTYSVASGILTATRVEDGDAVSLLRAKVGETPPNSVMYTRYRVRVLQAGATSIQSIYAGLARHIISSPNANQWYDVIDRHPMGSSYSIRSGVGAVYQTGQALTGYAMEVDYGMQINLTQMFGSGNEPTKEEMILLISTLGIDYFEGEITIPAQKIMQWQLKLIRKNKNAIIALGGTII